MSAWFLDIELSTSLTRENIDELVLRKIWQIKLLTKLWLVAVVSGRGNFGESQKFVNFVNIFPSQKFVPYST